MPIPTSEQIVELLASRLERAEAELAIREQDLQAVKDSGATEDRDRPAMIARQEAYLARALEAYAEASVLLNHARSISGSAPQ